MEFTVEYDTAMEENIRRIVSSNGKSSDWFTDSEVAYLMEGKTIYVSFSKHFGEAFETDKVFTLERE